MSTEATTPNHDQEQASPELPEGVEIIGHVRCVDEHGSTRGAAEVSLDLSKVSEKALQRILGEEVPQVLSGERVSVPGVLEKPYRHEATHYLIRRSQTGGE